MTLDLDYKEGRGDYYLREGLRERACRKCGSTKRPRTTCSHCGGHGMVTGAYGDPTECPECDYSGVQWPPSCDECGAFRSMKGWER